MFDVVIIGAGVVGCAMARRFTLEGARVAIIEKAGDILDGASKANSAILHTGFDAPPGSVELACIREGYREYEAIRHDLGLVQERTGAHVVAWNKDDLGALEAITAQAHENGVSDVRVIDRDALRTAEPYLSPRALGAAFVPRESLVDPWSAPYVYLRQALENGAQVLLNCEAMGGGFDRDHWQIATSRGTLQARVVINCAGLYGDLVDQAFLGQSRFQITPRKGQFVVFDKAASALLSSIILPVPSETTKGIVLFRTVFGNLAVGPTAQDQPSRTDAGTDTESLRALIADGVAKLPALADIPVTATYAGLRPATEQKAYRIDTTPARNWITVGGIRSTGLSAALGIARHVYKLYEGMGGAHQPLVQPVIARANMLAQSGQRDWQGDAPGEIVCHCEWVTRREIETALTGPLAARSLGGLKRQTRVTMGRCQGFYCTARLAEICTGKLTPPLSQDIPHA
jgi:glycerol-3-phosphate dehydrogenase